MFIKILTFALLQTSFVQSGIFERCIDPNHVVLTFDDGPREKTPDLVRVLNQNNINGTFFFNGIHMTRNPESLKLVKSMKEEGHTIASHSFSHAAMTTLNSFNVYREIYDNELVMRQTLDVRPRYFRPPYFDYNDDIFEILATNFGYDLVVANVSPKDWQENATPDDIFEDFKGIMEEKIKGGYIVLLHDQVASNVQALPKIIQYLKDQNYKIVSLEVCLGHSSSYFEDNRYGPNLLNGI